MGALAVLLVLAGGGAESAFPGVLAVSSLALSFRKSSTSISRSRDPNLRYTLVFSLSALAIGLAVVVGGIIWAPDLPNLFALLFIGLGPPSSVSSA